MTTKMSKSSKKYEDRIICLTFDQETYPELVKDANKYKAYIDECIEKFPELFPDEITQGYQLKDIREPKKLPVPIRRLKLKANGISYTIRPSDGLPYMTAMTEDAEKALYLRKYGVPFHGLAYVFGSNPMKFFRMEQSIGKNSIVGTTIKWVEDLPQHVTSDEKHSWCLGEKVYIPVTVANNCILGASVVTSADETGLTEGYGVFKEEVQQIDPNYAPKTVTTDGWLATQNAWKTLFSSILFIACFLHVFIKIRTKITKDLKETYSEISGKLWNCYKAPDKRTFSQRVRRLIDWATKEDIPSHISSIIEKLRKKSTFFTRAYDFPEAPRTTNMVDRLMRPMDKYLFSSQYFHGSLEAAELTIRAFALYQNFTPSNPYTIKQHDGWQSPAERLSQFRYHDNWLQNLLVSASQKRYFNRPQNPL